MSSRAVRGRLDAGIVNELMAIDTIRRDVHQIHGWPFNPGILAKLVTGVMLPLVLAMIATYLVHILQLLHGPSPESLRLRK